MLASGKNSRNMAQLMNLVVSKRVLKARLKRYILIIIIILLLPQIIRIYSLWVKLARNEPFSFSVVIPEHLENCEFSFNQWPFSLPNCLSYQSGSQIELIGSLASSSDKRNQQFKKLNVRVINVHRSWLASGLSWWLSLINRVRGVREQIIQSLIGYLPVSHFSLMMDVVFGKVVPLDPQLYQQFKTIGMLHVVAASGFNVVMVSDILDKISGRFSRSGRLVIWSVGLSLYLLFSDLSISIIRAGMMLVIRELCLKWFGRTYHALYCLATACLVILLLMPQQLFSLSFQLSVTATLGLIIFGGFLTRTLNDLVSVRLIGPSAVSRQLLNQLVLEPLATSLAAQFFTLPIIFATFGEVSLFAFVASVCLLWLTPVLTMGGLGFFVMGALALILPVFSVVLKFLSLYMWLYTNVFLTITQWLNLLPFFQIAWQPSQVKFIVFYLVGVGLLWLLRLKSHDKKITNLARDQLF